MKLKREDASFLFSVFLDIFSECVNMLNEGFNKPSSVNDIIKFIKPNLKYAQSKNPKDWQGVKLINNDDYLLNIITKNLALVLLKIFDATNYLNEIRIEANLPQINIVQKAMELEQERRAAKSG